MRNRHVSTLRRCITLLCWEVVVVTQGKSFHYVDDEMPGLAGGARSKLPVFLRC